jgi:hypothetical protein
MISLGREPQVRDHPKTMSPRGATELACGVSRRISSAPNHVKPWLVTAKPESSRL